MNLCRTCLDLCTTSDSYLIERGLENMLLFCVPELDLKITNKPVLCETCHSSLKSFNEFKTKCLATQKKMEIFSNTVTNDQTQRSTLGVDSTSSQKVVEKVAPFKLKAKNRFSEPFERVNNSEMKQAGSKRRHSEISEPTIIRKDFKPSPINEEEKEDLLTLLDNSKNVNNPKNETSVKSKKIKIGLGHDQYSVKIFKCKACKKKFPSKKGLTTHMYKSKDHIPYIEKLKLQESKLKMKLKLPELKIQNDVVKKNIHLFKCKKCKFTTRYKIGLNKHLAVCPKNEKVKSDSDYSEEEVTTLPCTVCKNVYDVNKLADHMKAEHSMPTRYQCKHCNFETPTEEMLRNHKKIVHNLESDKKRNDIPKNNEENGLTLASFACKFTDCGKVFSTKKALLLHKRGKKHNNFQSTNCPYCNRLFESKRGLKAHLLAHENKFKSKTETSSINIENYSKEEINSTTYHQIEKNEGNENILPKVIQIQAEDVNKQIQLTDVIQFENSDESDEKPICKVNFVGTVTISDNEELEEDVDMIGFAGFPETPTNTEKNEEDYEFVGCSQETIIDTAEI